MASIGIDLGTTNSCLGVWQNGRVEIIANDSGSRTTPSYVSFSGNQRLVGDAAKSSSSRNPVNTVFDAKRLIGRKFDDDTVQRDLAHFPFKVVNKNSQPVIEVDYMDETKQFRPEEISSMILQYLRNIAERYLGEPVTDAVITVPAYFNDSQRQATKDAGKLAGLNVKRVLNEPTAAAIAYGLNKDTTDEKTILVFDMGGGTFDVSLLSVCKGFFEVLSTAGDTHLGGEDFDSLIVDEVVRDFCRKHRDLEDPRQNKRSIRRLRTAVETAKKTLSTAMHTTIDVDSFFEGEDLNYRLTRAKFNQLCDPLFKRSLEPVRRVLSDANLSITSVDEIVMVGGSTRIPRIQELVSKEFGGKQLNMSINPDEAVAYGAAVNAAVLSGNHNDRQLAELLLVDVAPLSLGVKTEGGLMDVLIKRQTTIPFTKTKTYSTPKNNQTSVTIQIYEGERTFTNDNNKLGEFKLQGIPPMPRGVPQIEVSFNLNADGILQVSAKDKTSGSVSNIEIKNEKGRMSEEEIDQKIREAEEYQSQDEENARNVSARNDLENYFYSVLNNPVPALNEPDQEELNRLAQEGLDWLNDNPDSTEADIKIYRDTIEPLITHIYQSVNQSSHETEVVDADEVELET